MTRSQQRERPVLRKDPSSRSLRVLVSVIVLSVATVHHAMAQEGPLGITRPVVFPPFNPDAPACSRPGGLRKALTFAQDNGRKFMQGVARGLEVAGQGPRADLRA